MKAFLFLVSILLACIAQAQTTARNERTLIIAPVVNCDDRSTDLTQCQFTGYRIEHATTCTATTWDFVANVPKDQLTYKVTNLAAGTHCWRARAYTDNFTTAPGPVPATPQATVSLIMPGRPGPVTASAQ